MNLLCLCSFCLFVGGKESSEKSIGEHRKFKKKTMAVKAEIFGTFDEICFICEVSLYVTQRKLEILDLSKIQERH